MSEEPYVTPFPSPLVQPETSRAESGHDQISDFSWTTLYERIRTNTPKHWASFTEDSSPTAIGSWAA